MRPEANRSCLISIFQYQPDTFCRKEVKLLEARCQYATRGCPWVGKLIYSEVSDGLFRQIYVRTQIQSKLCPGTETNAQKVTLLHTSREWSCRDICNIVTRLVITFKVQNQTPEISIMGRKPIVK